ncbi:hypothetical protein [Amycolatopsis pigmentata]|uniref:DUF4878 domain-containing protein n=1 Tax=Amycolatopsis pigmentata TaxID=450801 RepID=A0ABW5G365_9PSEU
MTYPPQPEQPSGQQPGGSGQSGAPGGPDSSGFPQFGPPGAPDASGFPPFGQSGAPDSSGFPQFGQPGAPDSSGFPQFGQPGAPDSSGYPQSGGFPQGGFPQGGYPQSGGFPQGGYPQNFPANFPQSGGYQDQFGQPAYGQPAYPGYGQPGGFGAPQEEQRKSKTGLWIGLSVAIVVILGAVGVTGFVVPGFFLVTSQSSTPHTTLQAITDGLNKHDQAALRGTICQDGNPQLGNAVTRVDSVSDAKITSEPTKVTDTEYTGVIDVVYDGAPDTITAKLANENGKWCWKDASDAPKTPAGG